MQNLLIWLQDWYAAQCDGDWEHGYGVRIETLDNPGWYLTINLNETILEEVAFTPIKIERTEDDWISCRVEKSTFEGYGGSHNLYEILSVFKEWATKARAT